MCALPRAAQRRNPVEHGISLSCQVAQTPRLAFLSARQLSCPALRELQGTWIAPLVAVPGHPYFMMPINGVLYRCHIDAPGRRARDYTPRGRGAWVEGTRGGGLIPSPPARRVGGVASPPMASSVACHSDARRRPAPSISAPRGLRHHAPGDQRCALWSRAGGDFYSLTVSGDTVFAGELCAGKPCCTKAVARGPISGSSVGWC